MVGVGWGDHRRHLASQGRVVHDHCPDTAKTFDSPPEVQARSGCRGAQAVLPVFIHPGWLGHGWSPLGRLWRARLEGPGWTRRYPLL